MIAEFIAPKDSKWSRCLDRVQHDFYHLPGYTELCANLEQATPLAFYAERGDAAFLAPLLLRKIPAALRIGQEWYDCVSPYGYSSPLILPSGGPLHDFLLAFQEAASRVSIVTAFFRLHPFLPLDPAALSGLGRLVWHGQTVYIDLTRSAADHWAQTSVNHKRNIKRLHSLGYTVTVDDWRLLGEFVQIYDSTMQRVEARNEYRFSLSYFEQLHATLGDAFHLCCVRSPAGEVAAGGVFVETGGLVQYHLGATASQYLSLAPSKLMFHEVREWGKCRSNQILHLGGGVGGSRDSLFQFKAGFSPARADFFTYQMILDSEKYELLLQHFASNFPHEASTAFFPAYRLVALR